MKAPWDSNERWSFISNGSHIVIYENDIDRTTSARIYKLINGQPILTIEVPPSTRTPAGINSTSLIYSRQFIDLETGAATDTGWDKTATPVYITSELIVACSPEPITCSAWDMNDGTPTQRWSQAYAGRLVHSWEIQHVGDTSSGYIKMPIDNTTHFVSLTDGTTHSHHQITLSLLLQPMGGSVLDHGRTTQPSPPMAPQQDRFPPRPLAPRQKQHC